MVDVVFRSISQGQHVDYPQDFPHGFAGGYMMRVFGKEFHFLYESLHTLCYSLVEVEKHWQCHPNAEIPLLYPL
jgi:hypothetical protein